MRMKITIFLLVQIFWLPQIYGQCDGADFEERNGIAILEMESKVSGSWRKESPSGASASSALTYRGTDYFGTPGNSTITYKVKINSSGTYKFIWRNKISIIATDAAPNTEHNDTWLKIKASNFFGKRGSSTVFPGGSGKSPVAEGSTSGGWFKAYTNTIDWSWSTSTSDNDPHAIYATFNSAGVYEIQISGRSKGHTIDRMVLYKESSFSDSQAQSLSRSVKSCSGSTPTPPPPIPPTPPTPSTNVAPTVAITNPTAGQTITAGSSLSVNLAANDSDGSIVKHEVFVNNSLVDTDGASYTPYELIGIQPGTYTIRAVVTDNGGKTASTSRNITVGTGTSPNPPPNPNPNPPASNQAPSVSFTNLVNGQSFTPQSDVSVNLSAADPDGSVVKYEIFVNNSLVDTDGADYTPHVLSSIQPGNYSIRAVVTDDDGATTSASLNISATNGTAPPPNPTPPGTNLPPSVSFTNLTNGQSFTPGSNISVNIGALDSDGSIVKHQIFVNNTLVDTDGTSYTPHIINDVATGTYEIKATVTDNDGSANSALVNIVVGAPTPPPSGNVPPTVQILSPTQGQTIPVGKIAFVAITANDSDGSVTKHEVFVNNELVDTDGTNYTAHPFQSTVAGNYSIKVIVTDNEGATGSALANIIVGSGTIPPTPNPSPSSISFNLIDAESNTDLGILTSGMNLSGSRSQGINIRANVPSASGSVLFELSGPVAEQRVEGFAPFAAFGDTGSNYNAVNLANGSYALTATAFVGGGGGGQLVAKTTINFTVGSTTSKSAVAFPNPILADGRVSLRLPEGTSGRFDYSVSNAQGVMIEQGNFKTQESKTDINLELSTVGRQIKGVYYLTLISGNSKQIIPLLKQ